MTPFAEMTIEIDATDLVKGMEELRLAVQMAHPEMRKFMAAMRAFARRLPRPPRRPPVIHQGRKPTARRKKRK